MPARGQIPREGEEIRQQGMAIFRGDAFGMKLHAMHGMALVHHALDHAVLAGGGDFQHSRACFRGAMVRE